MNTVGGQSTVFTGITPRGLQPRRLIHRQKASPGRAARGMRGPAAPTPPLPKMGSKVRSRGALRTTHLDSAARTAQGAGTCPPPSPPRDAKWQQRPPQDESQGAIPSSHFSHKGGFNVSFEIPNTDHLLTRYPTHLLGDSHRPSLSGTVPWTCHSCLSHPKSGSPDTAQLPVG